MNRVVSAAIIVAVAASLNLRAQPQAAAQPAIADAQARLQARDPAGAVRILEAVTTREPANVSAWRMLGTARQQSRQLDGALEAYRREGPVAAAGRAGDAL